MEEITGEESDSKEIIGEEKVAQRSAEEKTEHKITDENAEESTFQNIFKKRLNNC